MFQSARQDARRVLQVGARRRHAEPCSSADRSGALMRSNNETSAVRWASSSSSTSAPIDGVSNRGVVTAGAGLELLARNSELRVPRHGPAVHRRMGRAAEGVGDPPLSLRLEEADVLCGYRRTHSANICRAARCVGRSRSRIASVCPTRRNDNDEMRGFG